ncbi:MAG TPA: hypothetical protein VGW78_00140 [Candidatus Babeliales bacterium]|nr:hypothetical protein [Candidatus Babeliales bacterium]
MIAKSKIMISSWLIFNAISLSIIAGEDIWLAESKDLEEQKKTIKKELENGLQYATSLAEVNQAQILKVYAQAKDMDPWRRASFLFENLLQPKGFYEENYIRAKILRKHMNEIYTGINKASTPEELTNIMQTYRDKITKEYDSARAKQNINELAQENLLEKFGLHSINEVEKLNNEEILQRAKMNVERDTRPKREFMFFSAVEQPSLWQKLVNWWYKKPSVTMGLTQIPSKQPEIPTIYRYRNYMRQAMPAGWRDVIKPWLQEKRERYMPELQRIHKQKVHEYIYGEQPYTGTPW